MAQIAWLLYPAKDGWGVIAITNPGDYSHPKS